MIPGPPCYPQRCRRRLLMPRSVKCWKVWYSGGTSRGEQVDMREHPGLCYFSDWEESGGHRNGGINGMKPDDRIRVLAPVSGQVAAFAAVLILGLVFANRSGPPHQAPKAPGQTTTLSVTAF